MPLDSCVTLINSLICAPVSTFVQWAANSTYLIKFKYSTSQSGQSIGTVPGWYIHYVSYCYYHYYYYHHHCHHHLHHRHWKQLKNSARMTRLGFVLEKVTRCWCAEQVERSKMERQELKRPWALVRVWVLQWDKKEQTHCQIFPYTTS